MANAVVLYADSDYVEAGYSADWQADKIHRLDLASRRIYLNTGVTEYHPVDDLYKEIRFIRSQDISLRVMPTPITAEGAIPKGGGKFTPRLAVFRHGWKLVPWDQTHALFIAGEQITDDGQSGPACIDTGLLSGSSSVTIHYEPPAAELVKVEVEAGGDPAAIADAVWSYTR